MSDVAEEPAGTIHLEAEGDVTVSGDVVAGDKRTTVGYSAEQLRAVLAQLSATFQPRPFDGRNPYPGLVAFEESDADRFFGREALVARLIERIAHTRALILAGPSGSGKSSLVRAGLLHGLRAGSASGSGRWLYAVLRPSRNPFDQLALSLSRLLKTPGAGDYVRGAREDPALLQRFAETALGDDPAQRLWLIVDQLEEVFTQVSDEPERAAFLNLLTTTAALDGGRVGFLGVLRSDFVSACARYPGLNAVLNEQFLQVGAMQPEELVSAIARPALEVGLRIDPDLVAQIVDDLQEEPGALPLMQFALKDLFDAQQEVNGLDALTLEDYLERGGLRRALERHADRELSRLSAPEQTIARAVFSGLVAIGPHGLDARRSALVAELAPSVTDRTAVTAVVRRLADARLLTTAASGLSRPQVSLAHERLIDAWPWLARLVNENRETIALASEVGAAAQAWDEHGRDPSYLYAGNRLAAVEAQLARTPLEARAQALAPTAQAFLAESAAAVARAVAEREAQRQRELDAARRLAETQAQATATLRARNRVISIVGGLAAITAVATCILSFTTGLLGLQARGERDLAEAQGQLALSRQLAYQTEDLLARQPQSGALATLLALEAVRRSDEAVSNWALGDALDLLPDNVAVVTHGAAVSVALYSPDGSQVLTADRAGGIRLSAAADGQPVWDVQQGGEVTAAAISPDGSMVASAGLDGSVRLWNAATGAPLRRLDHGAGVVALAFNIDGTSLATGAVDGVARVWEVATGAERARVTQQGGAVLAVAFSPDGQRVVSGGDAALIWEAADGAIQQRLVGVGLIVSVAFGPTGDVVATGSGDVAQVWDVASGRDVSRMAHAGGQVVSVAFSPDGERLLTAGSDGTARVWQIAGGREIARLEHARQVRFAAFSPDGLRVISGGLDGAARIWEASSGQELTRLPHADGVTAGAFSPDGTQLLSASGDGTARIWSTPPGRERTRLRQSFLLTALAFNADGTRLATGDGFSARIWDALNGRRLGEVRLPGVVTAVAFSADGARLTAVSQDGLVQTADASTAAAGATLQLEGGGAIALSGTGERVTHVASGGGVEVIDVATGDVLARPTTTGAVAALALDHAGDLAAVATAGGDVTVWDVATGQVRAGLAHNASVVVVVFSVDGRRLATATADREIHVWDVETQQELRLLSEASPVMALAFNPAGDQVLVGADDGQARLWDVATGQELTRLGHANQALVVAVSPDGTWLASGDGAGLVRVWRWRTAELVGLACTRLERNLTADEWSRSMGSEPYQPTCQDLPAGP